MPQVDELTLLVNSNVGGAVAGLKTVEGAANTMADKVGGSFMKIGDMATKAGKMLTMGLTVPLVAVGTAAFKLGMDAQDAFASLEANAGVPRAVLDQIQGDLIDIASLMGVDIPTAADAFFMIWSGGMTDPEQALASMEAVLMGVNANLGESGDIAQLVAVAYANMGLEGATTLDVLTAAAGAAVVGPAEMGKAFMEVLGPAGLLGMGIHDMAANTVFLTNAFGNSNRAATGLQAVILKLVKVAPSGVEALGAIGLTAEDVQGMVGEQGLQKTLLQLNDTFSGMGMGTNEWMAALFPDESAFIAAQTILAGEMDGLVDTINGSEGALGNAFGVVEDTASFQLAQAWATVKNFGAEIGLELINLISPYLPRIKEQFDKLIEFWRELSDETKENVFKIAGILAALGPGLLIFGKFASILGTILPIIIKVATGFITLNPVFLAIAAVVAALAFVFFSLGGDMEALKEMALRAWGLIQEGIQIVSEAIKRIMSGLVTFWETHGEAIMDAIKVVADYIIGIIQGVVEFMTPILEEFGAAMEAVFGDLVAWFQENWPQIQETVEIVLENIMRVVDAVLPYLEAIFGTTFAYIGEVVKIAFKLIAEVIRAAFEIIKGIFEVVMAVIRGDWGQAWEGIKKIVDGVWDAIFGIIRGALNLISNTIITAIQTFATIISGAFSVIKSLWTNGWNALKNIVGSVFGGIASVVEGAFKGVLNWIIDKINWAIDKLNGLIRGFNHIPGVNLSQVANIPNLADGAILQSAGMVNVGDAGKETVFLPAGAQVAPNPPGGGNGGGMVINLNAPQNDPIGVARELGWEMTKRGAA